MDISDRNNIKLHDRQVAIIGLGRSGVAAARLADHLGAQVFVSDSHDSPTVAENYRRLQHDSIAGEIGGHGDRIYQADLWVLSPGIARNAPLVLEAQNRGKTIVSEIEFASWFTVAPLLAVTGSNGKTTTVHALAKMCQTEHSHSALSGNMGVPFSQIVLADLIEPDPRRIHVLEISSFQMEFIHHFRPKVSVFLNISPDHLDRYSSMDEYVAAKMRMAVNAGTEDFIVYNADDDYLNQAFTEAAAHTRSFSLKDIPGALFTVNRTKIKNFEHATLIPLDEVALPGQHNLANLLAAATAAHLAGAPDQSIAMAMGTFRGVPHRLEKVAEFNGVTYVNDSKATNLDAVKVALKSYPGPIILILGGKDKGGDFSELLPLFRNRVKQIIAIGQAQPRILAALRDAARPIPLDGLRDAVKFTRDSAEPGDIVLLSPGCASFDQFRDFEDRGDQFKQLVQEEVVNA